MMATYAYILISLLAVAAVRASTLLPCPEGKCGNITVFLGIRFGSKVITYPIYPEVKGLNEEEAKNVSDVIKNNSTRHLTGNIILGGDSVDFQPHSNASKTIRLWPLHRTTPRNNEIRTTPRNNEIKIDYTGRDSLQFRPTTTQRAFTNGSDLIKVLGWKNYTSIGKLNILFQTGTLNMTGIGITGDDLKIFFDSLSGNTTKQLKRLFLSRNNIRYLPLAVFPVDLEYGLQELTLNDNPLKFIYSRSSFELSRLRNLKILNLSRTGLYTLEYVYLPNLEVLDLSENYLSSIPSSLENLRNLQKLDLNGNHIISLNESPISSLRNLRMLSLANNGLKFVWGEPFKFMHDLKEVYLNNNNLKQIAPLDKVHHPTILHLRDNPFECSCPLLATFHKQTPIIYDREQLQCTDNTHSYPRQLSFMSKQDVHIGCEPPKWTWIKGRSEDVCRWISRHGLYIGAYQLMWWVLLVIAVIVVLRILRRWRKKIAEDKDTVKVPYNPLDENMIVA